MSAVRAAVADGLLHLPAESLPAEAPLRALEAGSYGCPIALRLAATARLPARRVAEVIAERLAARDGIRRVDVTGPGFLTIRLRAPGALAAAIVSRGDAYLTTETTVGRRRSATRPWPDRPRTFDNPGFRVRYAYARAVAVQRRADDLLITPGDPEILRAAAELELLGMLAELPARAAHATTAADTDPLRHHLERTADAYHDVYEQCPALPLGDEKPGAMHGARRTLAQATGIAVRGVLHMLGETPKERI